MLYSCTDTAIVGVRGLCYMDSGAAPERTDAHGDIALVVHSADGL